MPKARRVVVMLWHGQISRFLLRLITLILQVDYLDGLPHVALRSPVAAPGRKAGIPPCKNPLVGYCWHRFWLTDMNEYRMLEIRQYNSYAPL